MPRTPPPPTVWGKTFKNRVSPLRRYRSWQTSMAGFRLSVTRTVAANQTVASTAPHETPEEWPPSLPYKLMHKRQSERLAGFEQTKQKMMARVHRRPKIWHDATSSHLDAGIRLRSPCIPTSNTVTYWHGRQSRALVRRQEAEPSLIGYVVAGFSARCGSNCSDPADPLMLIGNKTRSHPYL